MNREEAKNILQLCRPDNEADRADPVIAEALAALDDDAELRAWFEAQQQFDHQFTARLHTIEAPAGLEANILAGMRAHRAQAVREGESTAAKTENTPIPFPKLAWIGIAAAVAVLLAVVTLPRSQPNSGTAFNAAPAVAGIPNILQFLSNEMGSAQMQFDLRDERIGEIQTHLARSGVPHPVHLPNELNSLPTVGCVSLDYNEAKISMICFRNERMYHLITAKKTDCNDRFSPEPTLYEYNGHAFRAWTEGDQVYILLVRGSKNDLPKLI